MTRAIIIGAGGYSGAELFGLLDGHPEVEIAGLFGSDRHGDVPPRLDELFPRYRGYAGADAPVLPAGPDAIAAVPADVALLATPIEASRDLAPALLDLGLVVIDLSGAFRLAGGAGGRSAVYGLPERNRERIAGADLIAAPGCYPTSIILPLAPLVEAGVVDGGRPVIADSASGVSGAGRSPSPRSMFCEVSLQPYGVLDHRHGPEIDEHAGADVIFTPHLAPFQRGILSTIHVPLAAGHDETTVRDVLDRAYAAEPFVRLLPAGAWPSVGAVRHTNFCDIGLAVSEPHAHLIVVSAIDNLLKGAAGQAVQCLNARFGFASTTGLLPERGQALLEMGQAL